MNSVNKFALGKQPFIRKADTNNANTSTIMRDFIIALLPLILFGWYKNGIAPLIDDNANFMQMLYPLFFVIIGGFTTFSIEYIYYFLTSGKKLFTKENAINTLKIVKNSFAVIPGLLLAMILPLNTPIWVLIICCFFATFIGKVLFGGFACNVFNPALVGYLFFQVAYIGVANKNGGYLNPSEAITIVSGATPLGNFSSSQLASGFDLMEPYGGFWNFFIGNIPGSLAETSSILCLVSCAYLIVRRVINWRIPVFYVGGVFILTYIIGAVNGNPADFMYPLFHVMSGGLLFGAVFMATEPITAPRTPNGKIVYALSLAVLTVLLRFKGKLPEGVATSIMAMNLFTIIIDRSCAKLRANGTMKKTAFTYGLIALLLLGISTYTIVGTTNIITAKVEFVSFDQDLETISKDRFFAYNFKVDDNDVIVYTNIDGEITEVSNSEYEGDYFTNYYNEAISSNKPTLYYKAAYTEGTNYVLEVATKGYSKNPFTVYFTFNGRFLLTDVKVIKIGDGGDFAESYDDPYNEWNPTDGRPEEVIPGIIVSDPSNIDNIDPIVSATATSNALKKAAQKAVSYMNKIEDGSITFNAFSAE